MLPMVYLPAGRVAARELSSRRTQAYTAVFSGLELFTVLLLVEWAEQVTKLKDRIMRSEPGTNIKMDI